MKTFAVLLLTTLSLLAAPPSVPVTLSFTWTPSQAEMAGLSTNDYATNIVFVILSTVNVTQPTNQWPQVAVLPAPQFLNQGPVGTLWTNQMPFDGASRFFALIVSNTTSTTTSFFSNLAPWFQSSLPGVLKSIRSP